MKIAIVSLNIAWKDYNTNLRRMEEFIVNAKSDNCEIIVFPEMFNTGFAAEIGIDAELPQSRTYKAIKKLSSDYSINIVAGISEKIPNEKALNIAVIFDNNGIERAKYSKLQPFNYANEGDYFSSGDCTAVFELMDTNCSVFICYDLRFPELFRKVAKNVEVIFVIANWPETREFHWQTLLVARAIENQCFIVGVNRIGIDNSGLKFKGSSMIINPLGKILMQTDEKTEYKACEFDVNEVSEIRKKFPFLEDIRFI